MSQLLWLISLVIVIMLGLASLFIVYNTVRLTLFMRREEIVIMKLVGATNWFVRGPFLVEGFIQGLIGSVLAIIILFAAYKFMLAKLVELIPFFTANVGFDQLFKLSAKLLMMGLVLGISGSLLSLRDISKFSKSTPEGV
jgi:cell division transport system permease protein